MLDKNELLFDELYEKTKDCGRVQFIKLLMSKEREIQNLKEELKKIKQPTIFIDTQDMEERYGEQLYQDYLVEENKNLQQELTNLKAIEKEHQRMNGELREEIKELKEDKRQAYNQFYDMFYHQLGYKYDFDSYDLKEIHKLEKILKGSEQ